VLLVPPSSRRPRALVAALALALVACSATPAAAQVPNELVPQVEYAGKQTLRYKLGPFKIIPGQNKIAFRDVGARFKPTVPGFITRFEPNIERPDGTVPGVDVIHLHHAVWLLKGYPTLAAGEEKTILQLPKGFGYRYDPKDSWGMTDMIHNLMPNEDEISITWEIDFVPLSSPDAADIRDADQLWMDVAGMSAYPVFDVHRKSGTNGRFTFPDQAKGDQLADRGPAQKHTVSEDMTLIGTAGHLHPGGLWTDLKVTRDGRTVDLFRSEAKYWEPAGPVSWDMAMTTTKGNWRIHVRKGDVLSISATYETKKASWYESMGIMNVWWTKGVTPDAVDPFAAPVATRGSITHGRLPENSNHGGGRIVLPNPVKMLGGAPTNRVSIKDFVYGRGDLSSPGRAGRPPVVLPGRSLTYKNLDATQADGDNGAYHTITACRKPCNKDTGVAYPLADGEVDFDSGELGFGPSFATPTENTNEWDTPKSLKAGTYTFFCRVHPFMRGAFRVKGGKGTKRSAR
jgi:hypothetical protein